MKRKNSPGQERPGPTTEPPADHQHRVEAFEDPHTGQFILSSNESAHAEIRAKHTIDLEASR